MARQDPGGGYHPVRVNPKDDNSPLVPFTVPDIIDHLEGRRTYGHYLLNAKSKCKFFAYDIDLCKMPGAKLQPREVWLTNPEDPMSQRLTLVLRSMAEGLAYRAKRLFECPVAISFSGSKGLHVIVMTGLAPAAEARQAARLLLDDYGNFVPKRGENLFASELHDYRVLDIEIYPKQDTVEGKDFGNLMRLPCGVHRRRGLEAFFIDSSAPRELLVPFNPITALESGTV